MPKTVRTIFLSSTAKDLAQHREAVRNALARFTGWHVIAMENFGARDAMADEFCRGEVESCDLFIGLVGECYGSSPRDDPDGPSFTEREYDAAVDAQRPRLIFLSNDSFAPPAKTREPDEKWQRQQHFRERLSGDRIVDFFEKPEPLAGRVVTAVREWEVEHPSGAGPATIERWERPPYPGLRAFKTDEAPIFFGRGPEIADLQRWLVDEARPLVAIIGVSGSGKSSLLRAGLLPELQAQGWRWLVLRPTDGGGAPQRALAAKIAALVQSGEDEATLLAAWRDEAKWRAALDSARDDAPGLLIAVDQAEELFGSEVDDPKPLVDLLTSAAPAAQVVLTMRDDFLGAALKTPPLDEWLRGQLYTLGLPSSRMLKDIVEGPARLAGLSVEDTLVRVLVHDAGRETGALPLLGFCLEALWREDGRSGTLRLATYEETLGGLKGTLQRHCERVDARLADFREVLPKLFDRAVAVSDDPERGRRVVKRRFVASKELQPLVAALRSEENRLLTGVDDGTGRFELAHEKLLEAWPALVEWLAARRRWLEIHHDLRRDCEHWLQNGRDPAFGWSHERVREAAAALDELELGDDAGLNDGERAFLGPIDKKRMLAALQREETTHAERAFIGERLSVLGDPRRGVGVDDRGTPLFRWCDVPPRKVSLEGGDKTSPRPVDAFRIAAYPVTVAQYRAFLKAEDGWADDRWWRDLERDPAGDSYDLGRFANHPAVWMSWFDATAFCRWASHRRGEEVRLPTEFEWQQAATRGLADRVFPWGPEWDPETEPHRANTRESRLMRSTAVGMYPGGESPVGASDMAGTVWEWCANTYDQSDDGDPGAARNRPRVVRGGSWFSVRDFARCAFRDRSHPLSRNYSLGFRVVCSSPISSAEL